MHKKTDCRLKCATCQITIYWLPILINGQPYCCAGCGEGGPCSCDYSRLPETGNEFAIVLHHSQTVTYLHLSENYNREVVNNV